MKLLALISTVTCLCSDSIYVNNLVLQGFSLDSNKVKYAKFKIT